MCESLENFANIHTTSTEQHKDLRPSSQAHDHKDFATFFAMVQVPLAFHDLKLDISGCNINRSGFGLIR